MSFLGLRPWNTLCYTKGMKKFALIFSLLSLIILSSCSNERLLDNRMRRMDGNWKFHRVNYKADSRLFSDNVTEEFEEVEWIFTEFGDVTSINHSTSDTSYGSFELELIEECNYFDGGCENIYFIHLYMINGQSVDHFIWEDARIRNQKIVASEFVNRGRYDYVLRKL